MPGDEHHVLRRDPHAREDLLHLREDGVVATSRAPADLLVARVVVVRCSSWISDIGLSLHPAARQEPGRYLGRGERPALDLVQPRWHRRDTSREPACAADPLFSSGMSTRSKPSDECPRGCSETDAGVSDARGTPAVPGASHRRDRLDARAVASAPGQQQEIAAGGAVHRSCAGTMDAALSTLHGRACAPCARDCPGRSSRCR